MLPVLLAVPFVFTLSAGYVLLAAPLVRRSGPRSAYAFLGAFLAAWMAGTGRGVFWAFPDWSLSYLVEARPLPRAVFYAAYALLVMGAGALGGMLAARALVAGKAGRALAWTGAGAAATLASLALGFGRLARVGTTLEWSTGFARPLARDPVFVREAGLAAIACLLPAAGLAVVLALDSARARGRPFDVPPPGGLA